MNHSAQESKFNLIHLKTSLKFLEPICGTPTQLAHGHISPMKSAYSAGENVTYVCNSEYDLLPTSERTCQDDGSWSGLQPHCKKSARNLINFIKRTSTPIKFKWQDKVKLWISQWTNWSRRNMSVVATGPRSSNGPIWWKIWLSTSIIPVSH